MQESMQDLNSKQRKFLRGLAHPLKPVVQIGKNGLTDGVLANLDAALGDHELIKVKFGEGKEQKKTASTEICERLKCSLAGTIGHVAILYRPARDPDRRKIALPPA